MRTRLSSMRPVGKLLIGMAVLMAVYPLLGFALYDFSYPNHETIDQRREDERQIDGYAHWTSVELRQFTGYWMRTWVPDACRWSSGIDRIFWPLQRMACLVGVDGFVIESSSGLSDDPRLDCIVERHRVVQP
jgi:hypothetical protein